jgi:hypothetical protein
MICARQAVLYSGRRGRSPDFRIVRADFDAEPRIERWKLLNFHEPLLHSAK